MQRRLFPHPTPDDQRILDSTNQLVDRSGLRMVRPVGVWWTNKFRAGPRGGKVTVASDFPRVSGISVVIAERIRGRLAPEELTPLIASSLFFYNGPIASSLMRKVLVRVVLRFFLLGSVLEAFLYLLQPFWSITALVPLIIALGLIAKLGSAPFCRDAWLTADRKGASAVGKDSMLQALNKVDSLGLADVEKLKRGGRLVGRPSITQRIENLQS